MLVTIEPSLSTLYLRGTGKNCYASFYAMCVHLKQFSSVLDEWGGGTWNPPSCLPPCSSYFAALQCRTEDDSARRGWRGNEEWKLTGELTEDTTKGKREEVKSH